MEFRQKEEGDFLATTQEDFGNYPWRLIQIFKELIRRNSALFIGTIHLCFWQPMQGESMWNSTRFIKELKSDFLGVNLVLILAKREVFLGGYSINFQ